eukprot:TRINITY_DN27465_c0_g1_i1.p1 TRINITY_DN27465_c0_g1~~TRINITY_DN27465_c0_g1_i1.p1  ORF type:complete len:418 (+),score=104.41 TRINITY_DN27465_c0_g1_i1:53-1306(+)
MHHRFVSVFLTYLPPTNVLFFFFLMIRRPPRSTLSSSSAASDVYKRQVMHGCAGVQVRRWAVQPATKPARTQIQPPSSARRGNVASQRGVPTGRRDARSESGAPESERCSFQGAGDPKMVAMIESDMIESAGVGWDAIARLEEAKRLLKEAVVLPLLMPDMFTGIREPWKGVLLHGPPGTGKTLLAKAVATECKTTFFNCSAASLVSKYHGESEKMVKTLFGLARHHAPSVVFFDEIDALMTSRGGAHESDATRRLKVEMLQQMDGIGCQPEQGALVMVLATTNKPWDLDEALRRRLEKRIYIPLPDADGRIAGFQLHLKDTALSPEVDIELLAELSDGHSGADIRLVCREAAMMPMRRMLAQNSDPSEIARLKREGKLDVTIQMQDLVDAIKSTNPSVDQGSLQAYQDWQAEFGST